MWASAGQDRLPIPSYELNTPIAMFVVHLLTNTALHNVWALPVLGNPDSGKGFTMERLNRLFMVHPSNQDQSRRIARTDAGCIWQHG